MKWRKSHLQSNDGKSIDCWRSDCKAYLIYLNVNRGTDTKKGLADRDGHRWWFQVSQIHADKSLNELEPADEIDIGESPTKAGAKELAACDAEGM